MDLLRRFRNRGLYLIEILLVWSPLSRFLFVVLLLGIVALAAGLLAYRVTTTFASPETAIWWAFLRLTDPGYLGDDQGAFLRALATMVTLVGYVLFVGALVAIMTQWLNATIARLERGYTPVVRKKHIVVLGWSLRTAAVVKDLLTSEGRVRRFLQRLGTSRLHVVVLAEETVAPPLQLLKEHLGPLWNPHRITVRCGTPLSADHLRRVDFSNAGALLLPGSDLRAGPLSQEDAATIKVLLSASRNRRRDGPENLPLMVAEVNDERLSELARNVYAGPLEVVCSHTVLSRLVTQCLCHPGLSAVFREILGQHEGSKVYVRRLQQVAGGTVADVWPAFEDAIFLGLVRSNGDRFRSCLAPPLSTVIDPDDRCILLSNSFDHTRPSVTGPAVGSASAEVERLAPPRASPLVLHRILIVGWNEWAPVVLAELARRGGPGLSVLVVSRIPVEPRWADIERHGGLPESIEVVMRDGDATSPSELKRLDVQSFDRVLVLATDVLESEKESDARNILTYLLIKEVVARGGQSVPPVVATLHDPQSVGLVVDEEDDFLVTSLLLSHVLTQVALRRELGTVFEELLGADGGDISLPPLSHLSGRILEFRQLQQSLWLQGRLALGLRRGRARVLLNPAGSEQFRLESDDRLIVWTPRQE
jgi:Trk K+ transport system NAD-binding subunit